MDRAIPVSNKLLSRKWEERTDALHQEKLRTIRARVDSASPPAFSHAVRKAKKEQMLEDHYTEVERENRLLLEKMSSIMQGKPPHRAQPARKRSLNQDFRRREMVKITQENQALLHRLQGRTSTYSTYRWETERKKTERLLQNICAFPYQLGVTAYAEETKRRHGSLESRATPRYELAERRARKPISTALEDRPRRLVPLRKSHSQELLFKRGINISDKYFLVEITKQAGKVLIAAFDIESPDSYNLELDVREALDLMGGERNFERLVNLLVFEKGELMLVEERRSGKSKEKQANPKRKTPIMTEEKAKTPINDSDLTGKDDFRPNPPITDIEDQLVSPAQYPSTTPVDLAADLSSEPLDSDVSNGLIPQP